MIPRPVNLPRRGGGHLADRARALLAKLRTKFVLQGSAHVCGLLD
jgi:hypothetical protein